RNLLLLLSLGVLVGCGVQNTKSPPAPRSESTVDLAVDASRSITGIDARGQYVYAPVAAPVTRKIIQNVEIKIIIEDFPKAEQKLMELAKEQKGYVAKSEVSGSTGTRRSGSWTIRVPSAQVQDFLQGVRQLGEVQKETSDAKDVTEEYYDLEGRLKNKRKTES